MTEFWALVAGGLRGSLSSLRGRRLPALLLALALPGMAGANHAYIWEGFEREINWNLVMGTAATGRLVDAENFTEGAHSMKLLFNTAGKAGRAGFSRFQMMDWSPYGALVLDIYNPTELENLRIGVLLKTTDRLIEHEFITPPLSKGWNRNVRVELLQPVFSCMASDYRPVGHLVGRSEVKAVQLNVYPGGELAGEISVDNIRLERAGLLTYESFTLNTTMDLTASSGNLEYLPLGMRLRDSDLVPVESFENGISWTAPASEIKIESTTDPVSHGGTALSVTFPAFPDGFDLYLTGMESKLAGSRQFRMDAYNYGPWLGVALQLEDNNGNTYVSDRFYLGTGWNTRVFDFANRNVWNGDVITDEVLRNLKSVSLNISSDHPGRLVFDGISSAGLSLKGAARAGTLMSLSYNPSPELEFMADTRVEDIYYGSGIVNSRDAGVEGYLEAASLRYDAEKFRSGVLYRRRVIAFDNPITPLISSFALGNEVAAFETGGRIGKTEVQGLVASRLKYDRYNRRQPTGFGPENVAGIRVRRDISEQVRLGATQVTHKTTYDGVVEGFPRDRQTWGLDLDSHFKQGDRSLGVAVEGALTTGDTCPSNYVAPENDRYYAGLRLTGEWNRLKVSTSPQHFGRDFDGTFLDYGSGYQGVFSSATLKLEGLGIFGKLNEIPLYDRSLGDNLILGTSADIWWSREKCADDISGELAPRYTGTHLHVYFDNDYKARPHFEFWGHYGNETDPWYGYPTFSEGFLLRVPVSWEVVASFVGSLRQEMTDEKFSGDEGEARVANGSIGLERYFKWNMFVNVKGQWERSRTCWEDTWYEPDSHFKLTAGLRQTFGANSVLQVDYGQPALYGYDYGIQDTIDVVTVKFQTYF